MLKRLAGFVMAVIILAVCFALPARATSSNYDPNHPENLNDIDIDATAAILIEANTGMVVYEKNADARLYPASTTKILTTYLGILMGDLDETVVTSERAMQVEEGSSMIPLTAGEEINFKDLLYATMIRSGNEGANVIAEAVGGSIEGFVDLMNQYVNFLGLVNTHFANPNGLHNDDHYTSARDMATITREAMQDETFRDIVAHSSYVLPKDNVYRSRNLTGRLTEFMTDKESSYYYPYAIGVKTGNTEGEQLLLSLRHRRQDGQYRRGGPLLCGRGGKGRRHLYLRGAALQRHQHLPLLLAGHQKADGIRLLPICQRVGGRPVCHAAQGAGDLQVRSG